jgi:hypothetical protein
MTTFFFREKGIATGNAHPAVSVPYSGWIPLSLLLFRDTGGTGTGTLRHFLAGSRLTERKWFHSKYT